MIHLPPKDKAIELVEKFRKELAIICVKEIIESRKDDKRFDDSFIKQNKYYTPHPMYLTYWLQIITEIENL